MSWGYKPPTKRIPADKVRNMRELVRLHDAHGYAFIRGKCYHPAVWRNWSLGVLMNHVRSGYIYAATLNPAHTSSITAKLPGARDYTSNDIRFEKHHEEHRKDALARDNFIIAQSERLFEP